MEHEQQLYQQPTARFNKLHDIYSLGGILLEIAVWSPVDDLVKQSSKVRGAKPQEVQEELLSLSRHKKVTELMGVLYSRIVQTCIEGTGAAFGLAVEDDDKENSHLQAAFQAQVVDMLKKVVDALKD